MAVAWVRTNVVSSFGKTHTISGHQVDGTNPTLVVCVQYKATTPWLTGITFNGTENLSRVGNVSQNNDCIVELWELAAPTTTTADVVVTLSQNARVSAGAHTYSGAHQANPFRTAAAADANGTDGTPTVDVVANSGEMVVDAMGQVSAGPDTISTFTGDAKRMDNVATGGGDDVRGGSQEIASSGATETMGYTMSSTDSWAIVAAPLQEAVSGTEFTRTIAISVTAVPPTREISLSRIISDAAALVPTKEISLSRIITDAVTLVPSKLISLSRTILDSVSLIPTLEGSIVKLRTILISLSLAPSKVVSISRTIIDAVPLIPSKVVSISRIIADSVPLVPSKVVSISRIIIDSITAVPSKVVSISRTILESVTFIPSILRSVARVISKTLPLIPTLTGSIVKLRTILASLTLAPSITRSIARTISKVLPLLKILAANIFTVRGGSIDVGTEKLQGSTSSTEKLQGVDSSTEKIQPSTSSTEKTQ